MSETADNINHPKHYELDKIECIDAMEMTQGRGAVMSFCLCNAFKYLWRHNRKNGLEDIKKANWYLDKYIELAEKSKAEINEKFGYMDGGYCDTDNCDSKSIKPIWTDQMTDASKPKEPINFMDAPKELKDQFFMEMMKRVSNTAPKEEDLEDLFRADKDYGNGKNA